MKKSSIVKSSGPKPKTPVLLKQQSSQRQATKKPRLGETISQGDTSNNDCNDFVRADTIQSISQDRLRASILAVPSEPRNELYHNPLRTSTNDFLDHLAVRATNDNIPGKTTSFQTLFNKPVSVVSPDGVAMYGCAIPTRHQEQMINPAASLYEDAYSSSLGHTANFGGHNVQNASIPPSRAISGNSNFSMVPQMYPPNNHFVITNNYNLRKSDQSSISTRRMAKQNEKQSQQLDLRSSLHHNFSFQEDSPQNPQQTMFVPSVPSAFTRKTSLKKVVMRDRETQTEQQLVIADDFCSSDDSSQEIQDAVPTLKRAISGGAVAFEIIGKKRRQRRPAELEAYRKRTLDTIAKLNKQIDQAKKNPDLTKKLKNQVSAYESRLTKRIVAERQKEMLGKKADQIEQVLRILKEELSAKDAKRVEKRIKTDVKSQ